MTTALEILPLQELEERRSKARQEAAKLAPGCGGILLFSSLSIYYLTGTLASGCLWLPLQGQPVLALRKGADRAALESPDLKCVAYRSFNNLAEAFASAGSPLSRAVLVEQNALNWSMGQKLAKALEGYELIPGDEVLRRARAVKSPLELDRCIQASQLQARAMRAELAGRIAPGQSEYAIALELSKIFLDLGHGGPQRMYGHGAEAFFCIACAGTNSYYPGYADVPTGCRGLHPSAPYLGSPDVNWEKGQLLVVDANFVWQGYMSDITQCYYSGRREGAPKALLDAEECLLHIERECAALLRPGAIPEDIYAHSLAVAVEHGFADSFMGRGKDQARFLGHGIGLLMDDWPPIAKGFTEPLQENMVIALEPKITLPGIGMPGIENTFLVTPEGGRSLTGTGEFIFVE